MVLGLTGAALVSSPSVSPRDPSQHLFLAQLLDSPLGNDNLSAVLRSGAAPDLREAFERLSNDEQSRIRETWSFAADEIVALGNETETELRDEALLQLAGRLQSRDLLAQATAIYERLASGESRVRARARSRLDAINGVGDSGARAEFLAQRFVHELQRPEMLIGMGAAGLTFRLTRLAATARLAESLGGAWRIRAAANSIGFLAETVAFTGATKLSAAAFGVEQDWSPSAVGREWAGGALSLFGLKAMGGLSSAALGRWARGSGAFEVFSRAALPQAAMLGGIFIGHQLEERAGLRPHRDGATTLVDSLALLLQFNAAGRVLHGLGGPGLRSFEARVDAHTERISSSTPPSASLNWASIFRGPRLVEASGPAEGALWMSADGPNPSRPQPTRTEGGEAPKAENRSPENGGNGQNGQAHAEAEVAPQAEVAPFDPQSARYHLPRTKYFEELRGDLSFDSLVGYAQAVDRARLIGVNLRNTLQVPMVGPLEYSPYGAALVEHIRENPELANTLTGKNERALIASPGTAILGLGAARIGPELILEAEAADAIMQGKAKYFLLTAGVSATPLCVRSYFSPEQVQALEAMSPRERSEQARIWRAQHFANTVLAIAPNFGFINVEDAQGKDLPLIFGVLQSLRGNTALWSDDMQGTGIITAAAMLGWAELTGRLDARGGLGNARGVIFGAGAGAMGVYDELVNNGMQPENILVTDSQGSLHAGRSDVRSDPYKMRMREGISEGMTVERFARRADFILNLGVKDTFTDNPRWTQLVIESLGENPFVGAMTNPEPGLSPEQLRQIRADAFYGSGNQTYENPVNNFTAFGYIGAGALMARAGTISPAMTVAAARGIFEVAKLGPPPEMRDRLAPERREFGRHWLVPRHDDLRLISAEAGAVAKAAARDGVAIMLGEKPSPELLARFDREIDGLVAFRQRMVGDMRAEMEEQGRRYLTARYAERYTPFRLEPNAAPLFEVAPLVARRPFEYFAQRMGLREGEWRHLLNAEGELVSTAFPDTLERLLPDSELSSVGRDIAHREIKLIVQLTAISPPLGLALAVRRGRTLGMGSNPTVFHHETVLRTVLDLVPEARPALEQNFADLPHISE